jgi:hypothetical protein
MSWCAKRALKYVPFLILMVLAIEGAEVKLRIYLKDGTLQSGNLVSENVNAFVILTRDGRSEIPKNKIMFVNGKTLEQWDARPDKSYSTEIMPDQIPNPAYVLDKSQPPTIPKINPVIKPVVSVNPPASVNKRLASSGVPLPKGQASPVPSEKKPIRDTKEMMKKEVEAKPVVSAGKAGVASVPVASVPILSGAGAKAPATAALSAASLKPSVAAKMAPSKTASAGTASAGTVPTRMVSAVASAPVVVKAAHKKKGNKKPIAAELILAKSIPATSVQAMPVQTMPVPAASKTPVNEAAVVPPSPLEPVQSETKAEDIPRPFPFTRDGFAAYHFARARAFLNKDSRGRAIQELHMAAVLNMHDEKPYLLLGKLYAEEGVIPKAKKYLDHPALRKQAEVKEILNDLDHAAKTNVNRQRLLYGGAVAGLLVNVPLIFGLRFLKKRRVRKTIITADSVLAMVHEAAAAAAPRRNPRNVLKCRRWMRLMR